jgi:hypothetical protein
MFRRAGCAHWQIGPAAAAAPAATQASAPIPITIPTATPAPNTIANEEPDPLPPPTVSTARAKAEQAHCQYAEAVQLYSTALALRWHRSTLRLLGAARNDPGCIAGGAAGGQRTQVGRQQGLRAGRLRLQ